MEKNKNFFNIYDFLAPIYNLLFKPFYFKSGSLVASHVNKIIKPNKIIIEIGCGTAYQAKLYKRFKKIILLDPSSRMLDEARSGLGNKAKNFVFLNIPAEELLLEPNTIDFAIFNHSINVINKPKEVINTLLKILKSEGQIIINTRLKEKNENIFIVIINKILGVFLQYDSNFSIDFFKEYNHEILFKSKFYQIIIIKK